MKPITLATSVAAFAALAAAMPQAPNMPRDREMAVPDGTRVTRRGKEQGVDPDGTRVTRRSRDFSVSDDTDGTRVTVRSPLRFSWKSFLQIAAATKGRRCWR